MYNIRMFRSIDSRKSIAHKNQWWSLSLNLLAELTFLVQIYDDLFSSEWNREKCEETPAQ